MLLPVLIHFASLLAVTASDGLPQEGSQMLGSALPSQSIQGRQLRQADLWTVPAESAQAAGSQPCPARYDRMTTADVAAGAKPYVFGGDQQPTCQACKSDNERAQYCRQVLIDASAVVPSS